MAIGRWDRPTAQRWRCKLPVPTQRCHKLLGQVVERRGPAGSLGALKASIATGSRRLQLGRHDVAELFTPRRRVNW